MTKVNVGRVVLAGLIAGLIINVFEFIFNGAVLGKQWADATTALGIKIEQINAQSAIGWIAMGFAAGLFTAWLYAAIQPRYGAGARTALFAGLAVWVIIHVALGSLVWNGLYPLGLVASSAAGALVSMLAAGWTAGRLYRDEPGAA